MNQAETENTRAKDKRDTTFDTMKGIGIVSMIVGHLMTIGHEIIYSFHMPLFFILGGYFAKSKTIKKSIISDFKRLVIPYFIIGIIVVLGEWGFKHNFSKGFFPEGVKMLLWANAVSNHPSFIWGGVTAIGSIWFLFALFWTRLSFNLILRFHINTYILGIVCFIIASVAVILNRFIICPPFAILTGLNALIFYYIGYYFRQTDMFSRVARSWILIFFCLTLWILGIIFGTINIGSMYYKNPVVAVIGATAAVLILYCIFHKWNFQIFTYLGIVSLTVLCIHKINTGLYIRDFLEIRHGWQQVLFDLSVCLCIIPVLQQFKIFRSIFGLPKLEIRGTLGKLYKSKSNI